MNLERWLQRNADAPSLVRCYQEWLELLEGPLDRVFEILEAQTENARRLRQNSPFAGVLTPQEVWAVKSALRRSEESSTLNSPTDADLIDGLLGEGSPFHQTIRPVRLSLTTDERDGCLARLRRLVRKPW